MKSRKAIVIWFTGLSGSGKTTISLILKKQLKNKKKKVNIIDGDIIRETLHSKIGFSKKDIFLNNKLVAELAKKHLSNYDVILVPIISPYKKARIIAKNIIGENNFIELFVSTPLSECKERDPKGLYKQVFDGELDNFIGISESNPYEKPDYPDLTINTINCSPEKNVKEILDYLESTRF